MLASGAHVKIGSLEYVLAEDVESHYQHRFETLFANATAIAGEIAKQQLRPEKMLWSLTDFSGGEGARIYYPQEPTTYDTGSLTNVTERGVLTTRARRYRSAVAATSGTAHTARRPAGASSYDKAVILWEDDIIYSRNAVGWTSVANGLSLATAHYFDADSDGRFLTAGLLEPSGSVIVVSVDASASAPTASDAYTGTSFGSPYVSEVLEGVWYTWGVDSGSLKVYKGDGLSTTNAGTLVHSAAITPTGLWGSDYYTDLEAAESSLFASLGTKAQSYVWEVRSDVGRQFWVGPPGFCIKKLTYHAGVLFCAGSRAASGKRFGEIWAIPLSTRVPIPIASPRKHQNEELPELSVGCGGPDSKVFFGDAHSGKIFVYDLETEGLSLFDDLANGGTGDGMSFTPWTNLLPLSMSTLEGGLTAAALGWTGESGTWTTTTTGSPSSGLYHLAQSATGTAVIATPSGLNGFAVSASTSYTAMCFGKCATASGTFTIGIRWYDSSGSLLSTSSGSAVTFAAANQAATVTATSPSTAAYAAIVLSLASAPTDDQYFDGFSLHPGSSTSTESQIAFLAMHGSRLFGATWQPYGTDTSLQVFSYEDLRRENRDASQAISATHTSAEWDFGVPQELKALIGFYVSYEVTDSGTTSGLVANSRITVSYATDGGSFTDTTTITSATSVTTKGRHFIGVSDGSSTVKFSRLRVKVTLDNNASAVAPPILYSVVAEAQLMAYAETWDLVVRTRDEDMSRRPTTRQNRGSYLRDNLEDLAQNKAIVTFLDGARYQDPNHYTTHTVMVEDPIDIIQSDAQGVCQVRLRAVPV